MARYIADLTRHNPQNQHWVLWIGRQDDVLGDVTQQRYYPVTLKDQQHWQLNALQRLLAAIRVQVLHVHWFTPIVLELLAQVQRLQPLPYIITLHDLNFYYANLFQRHDIAALKPTAEDTRWQQRSAPILKQAQALIAPSAFIARLAQSLIGDKDKMVSVIPHGITIYPPDLTKPTRELADHLWQQSHYDSSRPTLAIVGAIGPHKGREVLQAIFQQPQKNVWYQHYQWVLIGYTDLMIYPQPARLDSPLLVHGVYDEAELAGLLHHYQTALVYFPNIMPESFSYTLSEVWAAGIPVLASANSGAVAERIQETGGGVMMPATATTTPVAIAQALEPILTRLLRDKKDTTLASLRQALHSTQTTNPYFNTIEQMTTITESLYCAIRRAQGEGDSEASDLEPDLEQLQPLLAANLAYVNFRHELVQFSRDNYALLQSVNALQESFRLCQQQLADEKQWGHKLAQDIATLQQQDIPALQMQLAATQTAWQHSQQQAQQQASAYQQQLDEQQQHYQMLLQHHQQLIKQLQHLQDAYQALAENYAKSQQWSEKLAQDIQLLKRNETVIRNKIPDRLFQWLLK